MTGTQWILLCRFMYAMLILLSKLMVHLGVNGMSKSVDTLVNDIKVHLPPPPTGPALDKKENNG